MPTYGINVATGTAPTNLGYTMPGSGDPFVWVNLNTSASVTIANCGNWCSPAGCTVPAATAGNPIVPGTCSAQVLQTPNLLAGAFSSTGWNTPGMPHVSLSPWPTSNEEKEVA